MRNTLNPRRSRPIAKLYEASTGWRRWVAIFTMLAFSLQVQLVQTHIHPVSLFTGVVSQVDAAPYATKAPAKKVPPANNDPANCPICQAVLHGGQFISPSAVALALPSEVIVLIPLAIAARARIEAASHNWQGRAPPRA